MTAHYYYLPPSPMRCPVCGVGVPYRYFYGAETWLCAACDLPTGEWITPERQREWREQINLALGRARDWKRV